VYEKEGELIKYSEKGVIESEKEVEFV